MATYKVIFFDEEQGGIDAVEVSASSVDQAIEKVELMGEYEVIDIELQGCLYGGASFRMAL